MPSSILNLKFKGNKSFVAFSNLGDTDSLTKTWKVCSKVASYLEQGQRLENLSWRLWHLQNLMVESDNARSKREFKKLSKCMGDKLDKEKGRSIEELEAPGFKRNMSTDKIRLRAEEKERNREANQNGRPGTIKRMQFTFSVDQPNTPFAADMNVKKPDLKPSQQFKDTHLRRGRPTTRTSNQGGAGNAIVMDHDADEKDANVPGNEGGRLGSPHGDEQQQLGQGHVNDMTGNDDSDSDMHNGDSQQNNDSNNTHSRSLMTSSTSPSSHSNSNSNDNNYTWDDSALSLRFPSIFTNDFGPSALLYPQPSLSQSLSYGEGMATHSATRDGFSVNRPTIELPLDELLNDVNMGESPGAWSSAAGSIDHLLNGSNGSNNNGVNGMFGSSVHDDVDMKSMSDPGDIETHGSSGNNMYPPMSMTRSTANDGDNIPDTVRPSQVGPPPRTSSSTPTNHIAQSNGKPTLTVKTTRDHTNPALNTRSSVNGNNNANNGGAPSATATSSMNPATLHTNNSAPGGVKAECSNCGATHTPLWRRGLNDELNCNACGLYCKLHKRPRPKTMRNSHGEGRSQAVPRQDSVDVMGEPAQCYNCHTMATPLWRKDDEGKTVCNACGLYFKLHGSARPISMKSDVIRKRSRHDARRVGTGEPPSASPGASRRPSPVGQSHQQPSPTLAPDSSTQVYNFNDQYELLNSLLAESHHNIYSANGGYEVGLAYSSFPGPFHPDYLQNMSYTNSADVFPYSDERTGGAGDSGGAGAGAEDHGLNRSTKRRRMSQDSASEPPSSATSYSSYVDQQSSATTHSARSSLDFPFSNFMGFAASQMRGGAGAQQNAFWHPPMLPQEKSPNMLGVHPPMLLGNEESPMDFLHPPMLPQQEEPDLFSAYLHPPMVVNEDSPMTRLSMLHPHQHQFAANNNNNTNGNSKINNGGNNGNSNNNDGYGNQNQNQSHVRNGGGGGGQQNDNNNYYDSAMTFDHSYGARN